MRNPNAAILSCLMALAIFWAATASAASPAKIPSNPLRDAYYGDLHLHTTYSFDAYLLMGTKLDPDTAYRFAKGERVTYLGEMVKRRAPLDFIAVTDHSENLGVFHQLDDPNSEFSRTEMGKAFKAALSSGSQADLVTLLTRYIIGGEKPPDEVARLSASAWEREIVFANRHYAPGTFTTLIAYEWTSMVDGANLHRNVIFRGDSAPLPFTSVDSKDPEDLWRYLDEIRGQGHEAMAIPHNSNVSNGLMFDWTRFNGRPIDRAYAALRQANEPLVEISQAKGTSDTHPSLSSNDEFADFEIYERLLGDKTRMSKAEGSYVRDGLGRGLVLHRIVGVNPYKFGLEGSSDLHSALSVSAQADYAGDHNRINMGGGRPTDQEAASILGQKFDLISSLSTSSGSVAGVWAEANTRESIYDALRRRESFATSGTLLKLRFFGGWRFENTVFKKQDWIERAYDNGAPMGGDLPGRSGAASAPAFVVWAVKDPNAANLDRVQIIKVWEEDGQQREKVFDVSWSDNRIPDKGTRKLPHVGNTVDLKTWTYTNTIGATELRAVWTDPEFDPDRLAAYYLRVLEIPTPRWSTLLAVERGLPIPDGVPATVQQRGWSSPIWYVPEGL